MGFYIQTSGLSGKAEELIEKHGAERLVAPPESYAAIPEGRALVVVIGNPAFEAAGFAYSEAEFKVMTDVGLHDIRPRTYLLMDRKLVEKLTGYKK